MRIPKTVTILGRKFSVRNNLTEKQMKKFMGDDSVPYGAMNYSMRLICILQHKNKDEQFVTYLHECMHVMQYVVGLNQVTDVKIAELWCESGANAMIDVFKQSR